MMDPLTSYHTVMRATRASGYPNIQYLAPHPYEMAASGVQNSFQNPFVYGDGWGMRMPNIQPPRRQFDWSSRITPGMRTTGPYRAPVRNLGDRRQFYR